jgi:2-(1,2-epoxy-1,2-dihydrophenyl)acetyl-CoA isomerase
MSPLVLVERVGPIATLTLNRPERHNSLVPELLEALLAALSGLAADPELRAVVLQANGRSFSTGGDLRGFFERAGDLGAYAETIVGNLNRVILALLALPVPVVAAVQGTVTGGSLGLVLASDIVLVDPAASFTPYYGVVGFSPDGGWTALLPAVIGPKRAAEALLSNRTILAEEAVMWGLANRAVARERLRREAQRVAGEIARLVPGSVRRTKSLLAATLLSQGLAAAEEGLEREYLHFREQVTTREARSGVAAFLERSTGDGTR